MFIMFTAGREHYEHFRHGSFISSQFPAEYVYSKYVREAGNCELTNKPAEAAKKGIII